MSNSKKFNKKGTMAVIAGVTAVAALVASSFAYFTDREIGVSNTQAGTLDILTKNDAELLDEDGLNLFYPGETRKLNTTVMNVGNLSADVRQTVALTYKGTADDFTVSSTPSGPEGTTTTVTRGPSPKIRIHQYNENAMSKRNVSGSYTYEGYDDTGIGSELTLKSATYDETTGMGTVVYEFGTGASATTVLDGYDKAYDDGSKENSTANDYIIDKYDADYNAEIESFNIDSPAPDSIPKNTCAGEFMIVFDKSAGNDYQDIPIKVGVITEAKQHRDTSQEATGDGNWTTLSNEEFTYNGAKTTSVNEYVLGKSNTPFEAPADFIIGEENTAILNTKYESKFDSVETLTVSRSLNGRKNILNELPNLKTLIIDNNYASQIGLNGLTNVENIRFTNNVSDLPSYGTGLSRCTSLKEVTLSELITEIPSHAFEDCTALKKVTLPEVENPDEGVHTIGAGAFEGCTSLKEIDIPYTVESIDAGAFNETSLTKVTLPNNCSYKEDSFPDGCLIEGGHLS